MCLDKTGQADRKDIETGQIDRKNNRQTEQTDQTDQTESGRKKIVMLFFPDPRQCPYSARTVPVQCP